MLTLYQNFNHIIYFLDQRHAHKWNRAMNGVILACVKQEINVSIATLGLNNSFILKYTSQPNAMISKILAIAHVALSVPLHILNVSYKYRSANYMWFNNIIRKIVLNHNIDVS